jgi:Protein of unknown function (DUF3126)
VDAKEVRQVDTYLKKLFATPRIRVVPKSADMAEVYIGEEDLGELTSDNDEGELSYNFRMEIDMGAQAEVLPVHLTSYLRRKFDNENIRVVARPKKNDSLEVYIGEEFIAVLFIENEKGRKIFILELPILDVDLAG